MRYLLLLGLFISVFNSNSQTCPPGDIVFLSQNEIDSFSIIYPNCRTISGNVWISGKGIKNLSGLNQIEVIYGGLNIAGTHLNDLGGFNKLKEVWGNIVIASNDFLLNLSGFPPLLDTIKTNLIINFNPSLKSLKGLENIEVVQWRLQIGHPDHEFHLPNLKNLEGLSSIKSINKLILRDLAIESLNGIESIEHIKTLEILGLEKLKDISALKNCKISYRLYLVGALELESLDGLQSVDSLGYSLNLAGLDQIESLSEIKGIELSQTKVVSISYNDQLTDCAVQSICQAIKLADSVRIINNSTGCKSVMEVENQCMTFSSVKNVNSITVYPNPASNLIYTRKNNIPYKIINAQGKTVQNGNVEGQRIPVENLPTGLYILQVRDDQKMYQGKFVKE
jgi:hypothetical protein